MATIAIFGGTGYAGGAIRDEAPRRGHTVISISRKEAEVAGAAGLRHEGKEVDTKGDAFFAVFSSARTCAAAAVEIQQALMAHPWPGGEKVRVRMGIHSGEATESAVGLVGLDSSSSSKPTAFPPSSRRFAR
jgi:class 3 adenylate cyclase